MISDNSWDILGDYATRLKYVFTAATTVLSVVSIRHETTFKTDDPLAPKRLTPIGILYLSGVIALASITIVTTIVGDIATRHTEAASKRRAEEESARLLKEQLDNQTKVGIKPLVTDLGDHVKETAHQVVEGLEKQGRESSDRLRSIQDGLVARAQRSADALDALNKAIETSASVTRESADKQQRLAEGKDQVGEFRITISIARDKVSNLGILPKKSADNSASVPVETSFRRAFFHGQPDVNTRVSIFFFKGLLTIDESACPQRPNTRCLKGSGAIVRRFKTTGEEIPTSMFDASLEPLFSTQPASSMDISVVMDSKITQDFPILAKDMEVNGFNVFDCVTESSATSKMGNTVHEAMLRKYEDTLPMQVHLDILEELRPDNSERADFATHKYDYVRVHDPSRHLNRGCLQTVYQVRF